MTATSNEYAEALFALALEKGAETTYFDALKSVCAVLDENTEYVDFLAAPNIPKQERTDALEAAFGSSVPEEVLSFVGLLCERGRIRSLSECLNEYERLYRVAMGISEAKVVSAVPLTGAEKELLCRRLETVLGHSVTLDCSVDTSLLGGVMVTVDGKIFDGTLKRRLHDMHDVIRQKGELEDS